MEIIQTIAFDITTPGITPRVYGKQGDSTSRTVAVNIYHNGEEWDIPSGAALAVRYKTPSGAAGLYDSIDDEPAVQAKGNQITAVLAAPIFAEAGSTSCELVIADSYGGTSTWRFLVIVEASSTSDTEIPEDYYNAFLNMASKVTADANRAEAAANSIDPSYLMSKTMYDPAGAVEASGGIPKYIESQKGVASGVATLGTDGKVPSSQLNMSSSVSSSSTTTVANSAAVKTVNDKIPTISSSVFSTSTVTAASSYAVKRAYDTALEAKPEFLTPEITCSDSDFSCSACIGLKIGRLIMIYATVSLASNGSFALKIDPGTTISINEGLPEDNGVMFITPKYLVTTIPSALTELVDNYIEATIAVVKGEYNLLFFYVSGS